MNSKGILNNNQYLKSEQKKWIIFKVRFVKLTEPNSTFNFPSFCLVTLSWGFFCKSENLLDEIS